MGRQNIFFSPVQTGFGAHTTSYTMCIGSLSREVKRPRRGVNHPPQSTAEVKESVELDLHYSPSGPVWPVLGRTLGHCLYTATHRFHSGHEEGKDTKCTATHAYSQWVNLNSLAGFHVPNPWNLYWHKPCFKFVVAHALSRIGRPP